MGRWNDLKGILSAAARLSSVTADACDLVTAARRLRSAPPRVCPHRQPSAARSDARAAPTQACTVNHRRIEHRSMVTPAASEVETRLPASPLQLWASPAQAKQTLLQKRRRVDAPRAHILGLPSRRARVKAEPTSCRRGGCGWAAGRPVAGARQAVARRRRSACYKFGVAVRFLSPVRKATIPGKGCGSWVDGNRRTRPTSPQTVPRLAAMTATRPQLVCVWPSLSGVNTPTRSSVTVSLNLRRARRTSTALSVACSSLRQKPGEQLLCCSHTLHS